MFKYAYKNIKNNVLQAFLLLVTLTVLVFVTILSLTTKSLINQFFIDESIQQYGDHDFIVETYKNSSSKFFSIKDLKENNEINDYIKDYFPTFEVELLVANESNEQIYSKSISSTLEILKKITNNNIMINYLNQGEAIITTSLANELNLEKNDNISLLIGDHYKTFQVVYILEDSPVFNNLAVFTNKNEIIDLVVGVFNPNLGNINPLFTENLYNKIYFLVADEVNKDEAIEFIKTMNPYKQLKYEQINHETHSLHLKNKVTSYFYLAMSITSLIFFLLLIIFVTIYFKKRKDDLLTLSFIGFNKLKLYAYISAELFILFLIANVLNIPLFILALNLLANKLNLLLIGNFNYLNILISFVLLAISLLAITLIFFKKNLINKKTNKNYNLIKVIIIELLFVIFYTINVLYFNMKFTPLLVLVFIIFNLFVIAIKIFLNISNFKKISLSSLNLKLFSKSGYLKPYLITLISISLGLFVLFSFKNDLNKSIGIITSEYDFDLIMVNTNNKSLSISNDLIADDNFKKVNQINLLANVYSEKEDYLFDFLLSSNKEALKDHFNFDLEKDFLLNEDELLIALPENFNLLFGYEISDYINIKIDNHTIKFKIHQFYKKTYHNIIISNAHLFSDEYEFFSNNSVFLNVVDETKIDTYKKQLISQYGKDFIYIVNVDDLLLRANQLQVLINMLNYIASIFIFIFIICLYSLNYLIHQQVIKEYEKLILLGISQKQIFKVNYLKNFLISIFSLLFALFIFAAIMIYFPNISLLFNQYLRLHFHPSIILMVSLVILLILFIIENTYIVRMLRKNK